MKLVKVKESGKLRVDMDAEELTLLYRLVGRISPSTTNTIYPELTKKNDIGKVNDSIRVILETAGMDTDYGPSGYSMRKYGDKN